MHHNAQRLLELRPSLLFFGRDLFPVRVHFVVSAALLVQLVGWPYSRAFNGPAAGTFRSKTCSKSPAKLVSLKTGRY